MEPAILTPHAPRNRRKRRAAPIFLPLASQFAAAFPHGGVRTPMISHGRLAFLLFAAFFFASYPAAPDDFQRNLSAFANENGVSQTFLSTGPLNVTGPFFQTLGTNGR